VNGGYEQQKKIAVSDGKVTRRVQVARHVTPLGGPAHQWNVYCDAGLGAEVLAGQLGDLCAPRGVHCVVKTVDDYDGPSELKFVQGVVFVFPSEPMSKNRPSKMPAFRAIEDDFRDERPTTAIQGYCKDPSLSLLVGVVQVLYTDAALDDEIARGILARACATHPYTPETSFEGNLFEIFEPGKAETVKKNDEMVTTNADLWRTLRRWGIENLGQAWAIRNGIEREVLRYDDRDKKALYRPIEGEDHNQLWLVLHKPDLRPADPDATPEQNSNAAKLFVSNSARAVRDTVTNLKAECEWFRQPPEANRRGGTGKFADMYHVLRAVTGH
jgi:hypothetical protein